MACARWLTGLASVFATLMLVGCTDRIAPPEAATPTEPVAAPEPPTKTVGIVPDIAGGLIRGKASELPPPPPPKPGEIVIPTTGATWPWDIASAPDPRPSRPVAIPDVSQPISGLVVRPEADRALVTISLPGTKPGDSVQTRLVWCDTAAGKALGEWEVTDLWVPLGLSPDGRRFLMRRADLARQVLAVWTVVGEDKLDRKSFTPHSAPADLLTRHPTIATSVATSQDIAWAAWVGAGRIVSSSVPGQLRVFEADTFKQVGTIDAVPGRPALTPDGKKVAFLVGNGVALLDPATATVTGIRRTGKPPEPAALAFRPDGKMLAIGGLGQTIFLDLVAGDAWESPTSAETRGLREVPVSFGWAGTRHLLTGHQKLHLCDPSTPVPVWSYAGAAQARAIGRETWVVLHDSEMVATLRAFELPHKGAEAQIAAEIGKPGVCLLRPGEEVRIDASAIPADRKAEVIANLESRLRAIGYRPGPAGAATVVASLDTPAPATAPVFWYPSIAYNRQAARLKLVKDEKVLWEQAWAHDPPSYLTFPSKALFDAHVQEARYGRPDERLFSAAPIPRLVRSPDSLGVFGHSDLTPEGIQDRP